MNFSNVTVKNAFHGSLDTAISKNLDFWWDGVETETGTRHIVTETRTLRTVSTRTFTLTCASWQGG